VPPGKHAKTYQRHERHSQQHDQAFGNRHQVFVGTNMKRVCQSSGQVKPTRGDPDRQLALT
jgi:hypothetical protein